MVTRSYIALLSNASAGRKAVKTSTVVPGFMGLGFSALPGFRAPKTGHGAWSVHKTLFGFRAPLFCPFLSQIDLIFQENIEILGNLA